MTNKYKYMLMFVVIFLFLFYQPQICLNDKILLTIVIMGIIIIIDKLFTVSDSSHKTECMCEFDENESEYNISRELDKLADELDSDNNY